MMIPAPGILLISDPFLKDPHFKRAVVFLCEHQKEGSFGFVLNRFYEHTLNELVTSAENLQLPVYFGGPVQMDTIHFLHQYPEQIPGSVKVADGIFWGGDFEVAIELLKRGIADAGKIRFYIGYSGWGEEQLETELQEKSWLLAEANENIVFHKTVNDTWKDAVRLLGGKYEGIINYPTDPQLN